ncbi:3',5'-cyclic AMP phosphodiesterase CpdA [Propionispira arboris]|uniref:3',5'-cyclic AMP phosphodiesterase CpdA n=1 Tax=Propionispira arboris TaxID=84035 RepID=A0A1H6TQG8_9FIRM|nr:metallophosphoesterase [Propionispira arboris]SEI78445.1 3',5'-cyclic AMP phosphodiesterase CpdA [Propionispira arboris]
MNSNFFILNGPYLLDPAASHMTIAWETNSPVDIQVIYGEQEFLNQTMTPNFEREIPYEDNNKGNCLYTAVLRDLKPDTKYMYQIKLHSGAMESGTFKTLEKQPNELKIVMLSDSHLFHTEKQFSDMVERIKPEFIIHSGDISFGTGYQHEQYVNNWFKKIPELLKHIPVFYIPGNHDDGPFYDEFFTKPQAKTCRCDETGRTYSFDCGKTHFTLVDSNSWGLFEMNAINSGVEADAKTKRTIQQTLNWIKQDLASEAAANAAWRVLVLHHPYTDEFNNRYIVPVAEAYNVNLVIGGHLHYYVKTVSIDPKVGAKTVYISQGSTQEPECELDTGGGEHRLLEEFPEVVAMGKSNYTLLTIEEEHLQCETYGFSQKLGNEALVDRVLLVHDEPKISISKVEIRRIDNNGKVEIKGIAENIGRGLAEVTLQLFDNNVENIMNLFGPADKERVIVLNEKEKRSFTMLYRAVNQGQHEIKVQNVSENITVFEPEQLTFQYMKLTLDHVKHASLLMASIEATNNLDREIFVPVHLYIDQRIAETKNIFFRGHEKKQVDFCYKFYQGGSYQVSIADQLPRDIKIPGPIRIIPRIQDKSGQGNYALLHGNPKVITRPDKVEICLEQYGDYIEIPARPNLRVKNAFSGMVWANVDRLAKQNEMGHNPLMVKGKSVGWGATYLMRMVVERAGGLKWGTCHDITEYSWQGGMVNLNQWTQYTLTFDKQIGGNSYCNGKRVAHVSGIAADTKLRNWENEPIFIGYSYIGHVITEIDRPKYFTHLPAKISQVRFYKDHLSEQENRQIYEQPQKAGIKAEKMAVWLDFHDILTVGTHTTEWCHPAVFDPAYKTEKKYWNFKQLKTKAKLPLQAGMKASVEVSDDGASIKARQQIILKNGTNYIVLEGLPPAQYIRIVTEFSAEVGSEGTFIPELQEYQISAFNETDFTEMFWSTQEDWQRGKFTGAVGFEPIDRLSDFPEYTDVIHG